MKQILWLGAISLIAPIKMYHEENFFKFSCIHNVQRYIKCPKLEYVVYLINENILASCHILIAVFGKNRLWFSEYLQVSLYFTLLFHLCNEFNKKEEIHVENDDCHNVASVLSLRVTRQFPLERRNELQRRIDDDWTRFSEISTHSRRRVVKDSVTQAVLPSVQEFK